MKRRAYRRTLINQFDVAKAVEKSTSKRLILAIDVAKDDMVAALTTQTAEVLCTLTWKHLDQSPVLLDKLGQVRDLGYAVEAVMESTGTYGDVLRHQLQQAGFAVYQVSGKRVHDAQVVYDGVASLHDSKCAC